jgi:hypothetical protein
LVKTLPRRRRPNTDEERPGEWPELRRRRREGGGGGWGTLGVEEKNCPLTPPFKYPARASQIFRPK